MHPSILPFLAFLLLQPNTLLAASLFSRQTNTSQYSLRTRTAEPSSDKNGLYVAAYHTGAGLNDAVLISDMPGASKGFLNDSYQLFDFGTHFPWGMKIGGNANYAGE